MRCILSYLNKLVAGARPCPWQSTGLKRLALISLLLCSWQVAEAAPGLKLNQAAGVPTAQVTVNGSGFSAYEAVDVYFDTEDLCLGATNGSGAFSCSLMIPREAISGTHWLTAVGRKSRFAAQKSFLVRVNWSQLGNGPQHRGYNPYENMISSANVADLNVAWIYNSGGSSPAVVNGLVYGGSPAVVNGLVYGGGNFLALDAFTGAYKWSYPAGASVGSTDGKLYALDAKTGAFKWSYPTGGNSFSPAVADGVVYVGSTDGNLYALDAKTGAFKWSYPTGGYIRSHPPVANGLVYVGVEIYGYSGFTFTLYALDAATGALKWSYATGGPLAPSLVANGLVYVSEFGGRLLAIKAKTGVLKWIYDDSSGYVISGLAVANGLVYVGALNGETGNLYALDAATGAFKWSYFAFGEFASSPTVANGLVYAGTTGDDHGDYDGSLYALDAATGALKWSYPVEGTGGVGSSPVVTNGLIYANLDGDLYCFSLDPAGVLSQKIPRPDPALLIPDGRLKPQVEK